jgi:hypothetical protein
MLKTREDSKEKEYVDKSSAAKSETNKGAKPKAQDTKV